MTPASEHLAHARAIRLEAPAQRQGAGCRNFSRLPARGGAFSLDILFFIEPELRPSRERMRKLANRSPAFARVQSSRRVPLE